MEALWSGEAVFMDLLGGRLNRPRRQGDDKQTSSPERCTLRGAGGNNNLKHTTQ